MALRLPPARILDLAKVLANKQRAVNLPPEIATTMITPGLSSQGNLLQQEQAHIDVRRSFNLSNLQLGLARIQIHAAFPGMFSEDRLSCHFHSQDA